MGSSKLLFPLFVVCLAVHGIAGSEERPKKKYSLCVTDEFLVQTSSFKSLFGSNSSALDAVVEPNDLACLRSIAAGESDCYLIPNEDLLYAAAFEPRFDDLRLFINVTGNRWLRDDLSLRFGVVVRKDLNVRSLGDLKGRRVSFLTTFDQMHVWAFMRLRRLGLLSDRIDASKTWTENILEQLSNYVSTACLMPRAHFHALTTPMKRMIDTKYRNLKAACGDRLPNSICGGAEDFELHRLAKDDVDVAFTYVQTAQNFLRFQKTPDKYEFLCVDGTTRPLDSESPCAWGVRPGHQLITNPKKIDSIDELRRSVELFFAAVSKQSVFQTFTVSAYENPIRPRRHLEHTGLLSTWISKQIDGHALRTFDVCVVGDANAKRCQHVRDTSYYSNYRPDVVCVVRNSAEECLEHVKNNGGVHAIDPYYYDVAREKYHLRPIVAQVNRYGRTLMGTVALIRTDSNVTAWEQLRGARSCHTAFASTTGLVAPLHFLTKRGLVRTPVCPAVNAISEFFSGGSCMPGANAVDESSEDLCALCAGDVDGISSDGVGKCAADVSEAYYGDVGALRCLFERRGDVAFVEVTQLANVKEIPDLEWTTGVERQDFELLTADDRRISIDECQRDRKKCWLMKQLPQMIVTKNDTPDAIVEEIRDYFDRETCPTVDSREQNTLFDSYHDERSYKYLHTERDIIDFNRYAPFADEYVEILKEVKRC